MSVLGIVKVLLLFLAGQLTALCILRWLGWFGEGDGEE